MDVGVLPEGIWRGGMGKAERSDEEGCVCDCECSCTCAVGGESVYVLVAIDSCLSIEAVRNDDQRAGNGGATTQKKTDLYSIQKSNAQKPLLVAGWCSFVMLTQYKENDEERYREGK